MNKALFSLLLSSGLLGAWVEVCSAKDASSDDFRSQEQARLTGSTVLIDCASPSDLAVSGDRALQGHQVVPVTGQPFQQAMRIQVKKTTNPPWSVQISTPLSKLPVRKNQPMVYCFSVRAVDPPKDATTTSYASGLIVAHPPWGRIASDQTRPTREWQRIYAYGSAEKDYAAGELRVAIHLGFQPQTLEFGGMMVFALPPDSDFSKLPYTKVRYEGEEADAPWRAAAEERIKKFRQGDVRIEVVNTAGKPLSNVSVNVQMKRHNFGFGTLVGTDLLENSRDGERRRQWFLKLFNRATAPIYWKGWAERDGQRGYLNIAKWLYEHKIPARGHVIVYPVFYFMPDSEVQLAKLEPESLRGSILQHVVDVVSKTQKYKFDEYDVTNELRDLHDVTDIVGLEEVSNWFRVAHKTAPMARMAINEGVILSDGPNPEFINKFIKLIKVLDEHKANVDVIGIQAHFNNNLTSPQRLVEVLDIFGKFNKFIHITEFDIAIQDEQAQADYMRDFLTVLFSHPNAEAVTQWGFLDAGHWRCPTAGLIRTDWTLKPSGQVYEDLVLKKWWTNVRGETDNNGVYTTRGYLGEYEIAVRHGNRTKTVPLKLTREGATVKLVLQ